jgi:hypothetical protein
MDMAAVARGRGGVARSTGSVEGTRAAQRRAEGSPKGFPQESPEFHRPDSCRDAPATRPWGVSSTRRKASRPVISRPSRCQHCICGSIVAAAVLLARWVGNPTLERVRCRRDALRIGVPAGWEGGESLKKESLPYQRTNNVGKVAPAGIEPAYSV